MCGRYYVDDDTAREIEKLVQQIENQLHREHTGDIRPSQAAAVLTGKKEQFTVSEMIWGFPRYQKKGLLINARTESVRERKMFSDSVLHRRCIIPAYHFYEWDKSKNKVTFEWKDSPILYMAGFYKAFSEGERFVIITTKANQSIQKVHDRMPLILEERELEDWVYDPSFLDFALNKVPIQLEHHQEYEQQSLFLS